MVSFSEPFAAYKDLFSGAGGGVLKADAFADCNDISADLLDSVPFSGRPWKMESWSPDQTVLVPNENYWVEEDKPIATRVVMVPKADSDTEINSLKSGEVGDDLPAGLRWHHRRPDRPQHQVHARLRHELRGPVLPAEQGRPLRGPDLP